MLIYSFVRISDVSEYQVDLIRQRLSKHFSEKSNMQRKESVLAKALLAHMLEECFGITDFFVDCAENGKPFISGGAVHFNISHCDDYVLCVCGDQEVGCDIENVRDYNEKVAHRFFSADEYRILAENEKSDVDFMRMWTLKESALKFSGEGLSGGLDLWDFSEYYTNESFCVKGLRFSCREYDNLIISICSADHTISEFKTDINKIIRLERGKL